MFINAKSIPFIHNVRNSNHVKFSCW